MHIAGKLGSIAVAQLADIPAQQAAPVQSLLHVAEFAVVRDRCSVPSLNTQTPSKLERNLIQRQKKAVSGLLSGSLHELKVGAWGLLLELLCRCDILNPKPSTIDKHRSVAPSTPKLVRALRNPGSCYSGSLSESYYFGVMGLPGVLYQVATLGSRALGVLRLWVYLVGRDDDSVNLQSVSWEPLIRIEGSPSPHVPKCLSLRTIMIFIHQRQTKSANNPGTRNP